jgi:hypothetical protein
MHGDVYANSCNNSNLEKLKKSLEAKFGFDPKLSAIIEIILCGEKNSVNRNNVGALLSKSLRVETGGVGEETTLEIVVPNNETIDMMLAEGRAWNTFLKKDMEDLRMQYFVNEACIKEVIFRKIREKWFIVEIGEYCD